MSSKSTSSGATILLVIILVLTFPIWIGILGGLIGVVAGLFGAMFGIMGALLGGIFAVIALPFKVLFGWGDWSCHWPVGFHGMGRGFVWVTLLIIVILILNKRGK
jgi:hypothetical protein